MTSSLAHKAGTGGPQGSKPDHILKSVLLEVILWTLGHIFTSFLVPEITAGFEFPKTGYHCTSSFIPLPK